MARRKRNPNSDQIKRVRNIVYRSKLPTDLKQDFSKYVGGLTIDELNNIHSFTELTDAYRNPDNLWSRTEPKPDELGSQIENDNVLPISTVIYDRLNEMIDQYPTKGAQILRKALAEQIKKYGDKNVIKSLEDLPDSVLQDIQSILFYEGGSNKHKTIQGIFSAIKANIPEQQDLQKIGDIQDEMTDFGD